MSYDPLSHSRHNAGDRSTKVGHAIRRHTFIRSIVTAAIADKVPEAARVFHDVWSSSLAALASAVLWSTSRRRR